MSNICCNSEECRDLGQARCFHCKILFCWKHIITMSLDLTDKYALPFCTTCVEEYESGKISQLTAFPLQSSKWVRVSYHDPFLHFESNEQGIFISE